MYWLYEAVVKSLMFYRAFVLWRSLETLSSCNAFNELLSSVIGMAPSNNVTQYHFKDKNVNIAASCS